MGSCARQAYSARILTIWSRGGLLNCPILGTQHRFALHLDGSLFRRKTWGPNPVLPNPCTLCFPFRREVVQFLERGVRLKYVTNSDDLVSRGVLRMFSATQEAPIAIGSVHQQYGARVIENMVADIGLVVHVLGKAHCWFAPFHWSGVHPPFLPITSSSSTGSLDIFQRRILVL